MKPINELLKLNMGDFTAEMIQQGEVASEQDMKLFILECLAAAHQDPSTEFPITYVESEGVPETTVEYLPCQGPQLTDEFVNEAKTHPSIMDDQIPGQLSLFPEDNKE
jgi:hypothetical protein